MAAAYFSCSPLYPIYRYLCDLSSESFCASANCGIKLVRAGLSKETDDLYFIMIETFEKAYGKVNLGLDIVGRRPDGYHLVRMVMQTVDLYDDISVSALPDAQDQGKILLTCDDPQLPTDHRNLAYKAAQLVLESCGINAGVHIDIVKRIPAQAGMAGGSADAAAVIRGMDRCFGLCMDLQEQDRIALQIGADVPFCLRRGTWLAEGIGEKLTQLTDLSHCYMVIIKPDFGVSTPWAYKRFDELDIPENSAEHPDIDGLIKALRDNDIFSVAGSMGNILETAVIEAYPEIQYIKDSLVTYGAVKALMSGSGPTVFGIFNSDEKAQDAFLHLGGGKYGKFKVEF